MESIFLLNHFPPSVSHGIVRQKFRKQPILGYVPKNYEKRIQALKGLIEYKNESLIEKFSSNTDVPSSNVVFT